MIAASRQKGFTLIEVMIVAAITAILAMIVVSAYNKYVQRARNSAAQTLLHNLALAEFTCQTAPESGGLFISIDGNDSVSLPNLALLADFGFNPDPRVGLAALPFDDEKPGAFILFAAHASAGSQIFVYNFIPSNGVRIYDAGAVYVSAMPAKIKSYTVSAGSGGAWTAAAESTLDLDAASGLVASVGP